MRGRTPRTQDATSQTAYCVRGSFGIAFLLYPPLSRSAAVGLLRAGRDEDELAPLFVRQDAVDLSKGLPGELLPTNAGVPGSPRTVVHGRSSQSDPGQSHDCERSKFAR